MKKTDSGKINLDRIDKIMDYINKKLNKDETTYLIHFLIEDDNNTLMIKTLNLIKEKISFI